MSLHGNPTHVSSYLEFPLKHIGDRHRMLTYTAYKSNSLSW